MTVINKDGQPSVFTWSQLTEHQWMDFRVDLNDTITSLQSDSVIVSNGSTTATTITEMTAQGVELVHSNVLMRTRTEMIVSIVVSDRDYLGHMRDCLPLYERKSSVFNEILKAYDRELRATEQSLSVVERNMFVDTSIEHLGIYERDLGIETISELPYDQRREQIIARYMSAFDQTTDETITNIASAYGNGEVEIKATDTPGVYEIQFVGIGIPTNLDGLKKALDIVIPAHIQIDYKFTFSTWNQIKTNKWNDVKDKTWSELREWEGAI